MRYARCPRCGCAEVSLIETHEEIGMTDFARHEVGDGYVIPAGEFDFSPGDPVRLDGRCADCGHEWRMRRTVV